MLRIYNFKKGYTPWNKGIKMPEYCGFQKGHKTNVGRKFTDESKLKMSLAKKGIPFTEEHKKSLSIHHADITREKHPRWTGGSRSYYKNISKNIMEKYLCRKIKQNEVIHHLDWNYTNNNIDNLYLFKNINEHTKYHHFLRRIVKNNIK
jgi:hypothetical protein